jgi:DNA repair exonuclease SbcCD nuclease subunit
VVLVHSSDLHLGPDSGFGAAYPFASLSHLREVLAVAVSVRADLVVLAGDTFDNNRQNSKLLERTAEILTEHSGPIVVLPGNHDPLTPDSVYRRAELGVASNLCVLGLTVEEAVVFEGLELEVWGRAHMDYYDMSPLREPRSRSTRWQLAAAHGHYVDEPKEPSRFLGSWLILPDELIATGADYVALGHWNRAENVGNGRIHAYYSGSPEYAGTVNVVRLRLDGTIEVTRDPLPGGNGARPSDRD